MYVHVCGRNWHSRKLGLVVRKYQLGCQANESSRCRQRRSRGTLSECATKCEILTAVRHVGNT